MLDITHCMFVISDINNQIELYILISIFEHEENVTQHT